MSGDRPESFGKVGPSCVLGDDIEESLCVWMKESCAKGFPVTKDGLCYSVQKILNETNLKNPFTDNRPGRKWFDSFMVRHPELSVKQSEYISKARAAVTAEKIRKWFQNTLDDLGDQASVLDDPKRIWNMDETSFYLNPTGGFVIAEKGKHVYATSTNSDKENVTTLITVNAVGDYAPPLTMYKFERIPSAYYKAAPPHWGIGKSKNGWMTAESFYNYFEKVFYPFLLEKQYTLPVIVFLDGHSSHLSLQLSRFCRDHSIIIVCLYPNTTHILQPLDVAFFFPLKCHWKKALRTWRLEHDGMEVRKQDVPALLYQILITVPFKTTIINGFRKCGLYPFQPENVDYTKCVADSVSLQNVVEELRHEPINQEAPILNERQNFKQECLTYLETKIESNILEEFKMQYEKKELTNNKDADMLFRVWSSIKNDLNETSEAEPNLSLGDVIEFPFPEFEHVTAENSNILEPADGGYSWLLDNIEYNEQSKYLDDILLVDAVSKDNDLPTSLQNQLIETSIETNFVTKANPQENMNENTADLNTKNIIKSNVNKIDYKIISPDENKINSEGKFHTNKLKEDIYSNSTCNILDRKSVV